MSEVSIIAQIEQMLPKFTKTQRLVASEVLNNPTFIAFASVEQMAKKVGVSTASVVRFSNALGFNGYSELQAKVQEYYQSLLNPVMRLDQNMLDPTGERAVSHLESIFQQQLSNLQTTYSFDLEGKVKAAVQLIKSAKQIYTCGSRGSFAVSYYLGHHLNRVLHNCDILEVDDRLPDYLFRMKKEDLFIVVNQPRYNRRLIKAAQIAHQKGVKLIVITDSYNSPYAELADVLFPAQNASRDFHNSITSSIFIDEVIISMVISDQFTDTRQALNELEPLLQSMEVFNQP